MNTKEFDFIINDAIKHIKKTLAEKRIEYANDDDIFYNFELGAKLSKDSTKEQTLWNYNTKHIASIIGMIFNDVPLNKELVREKIGDAINYLILLQAMFFETIDKKHKGVDNISDRILKHTE